MSALPPNAINADEFNMRNIRPTTHLFFDDVMNNIVDVQTAANELQLQLQSVHFPGDSLLLYYDDADTKDNVVSINNVNDYVKLKHMDPEFKNFKPIGGEVGPGITYNMIQQIISYENEQASPSSGRIYFFDFDRVLNQLGGLDFSFLNSDPNVDTDMNPYARFLFSDHIEPNNNTTMDRFNLLKRMFLAIPPERVYVVTANRFADASNPSNPYSRHFLNIVKTLNPDFIPTHLIFSRQKSEPIVSILQSAALPLPLPLPLAVPRSAKPVPKPLPVSKSANPLTKSVITRSAMPFINPVTRMTRSVRSARPVRPVIRPRLIITTKRKGGARRRSKFLHTRRRRIVT
jgi:hypothetical protein